MKLGVFVFVAYMFRIVVSCWWGFPLMSRSCTSLSLLAVIRITIFTNFLVTSQWNKNAI